MQRGKKINTVAIGAFIFTGLFLFLFFIYFAGKFSFLIGGGYKLNVEYDFLDNLQSGAKVKVLGGPAIGYVGKINFETGKIVCEIMVDGKYKINREAQFAIYSTSLVGQKYINVSGYMPGSTDIFTNNEYIIGITPMGFARTIEVAGAGLKNFLSASNTEGAVRAQDVFRNTSELIAGLNRLVNDNARDIHQTVASINGAMKNTGELMQRVNTTVANLEASTKRLNTAVQTIDPQQISDIVSNIDKTALELKKLSTDINALTYDKNSALSLMREKEMRTRLEAIVKNFEVFSEKIKNNPSALLFGGNTKEGAKK